MAMTDRDVDVPTRILIEGLLRTDGTVDGHTLYATADASAKLINRFGCASSGWSPRGSSLRKVAGDRPRYEQRRKPCARWNPTSNSFGWPIDKTATL